jgi:SSS family solute:Na+ symporter
MNLQALDLAVVAIYAIVLLVIAQWVSREKAGHTKNTSDYFLAGRALPWWAIGASLIAANISAEQIIGMSGSAWVLGIAIGAYEWMAAITLILVGKYLLPVFLKHPTIVYETLWRCSGWASTCSSTLLQFCGSAHWP